MRILIDCTPLFAGGGVQVAIAFLENLASNPEGNEWCAAVPSHIKDLIPPNLFFYDSIVLYNKASHMDRVKIHLKLRQLEREFQPDVVFTVFGPPYFRARVPHIAGFALPRMIYPPPTCARLGIVERIGNLCRGAVFRRLDHLIVETATVKDRLTQRVGIAESCVSVIGNSINPVLARIPPSPDRMESLKGILIPAVSYAHKNLKIIPAVAACMAAEQPHLNFEFRLTLLENSPAWDSIRRQARALGVEGRVMTLGSLTLKQLAEEYCRCSVVYLPTLLEASTAVYPESFYFKRPLVTSDLDFARELCGPAALFANPLIPKQSAAAILKLLNDNAFYHQQTNAGVRQLKRQYPQPEEKFRMQMAVLTACARRAQP